MPGDLTEITEITTALGMLRTDLASALWRRPAELTNVADTVWDRLVAAFEAGAHAESFATAFANGRAFLAAPDALAGRPPRLLEWKGPHRPPGDDPIPADLRIDHVYLVSCKYLSKVLSNPGPPRLFDRLLVGDTRSGENWFGTVAPQEFQAFYCAAVTATGLTDLPEEVAALSRGQQQRLKAALMPRLLPEALRGPWGELCEAVAQRSAARWFAAMALPRDRLRLLWRLLRISSASYFVLGTDRRDHLRFRVDSSWDWVQAYELVGLEVAPRPAGQAEVGWRAAVRRRRDGEEQLVQGHIEIRWSHGRFVGSPEAKVYLDTAHDLVPGYNRLQ